MRPPDRKVRKLMGEYQKIRNLSKAALRVAAVLILAQLEREEGERRKVGARSR